MAIIKAAARLILREHVTYRFADPVLCLGVPDIYLTSEELSDAVKATGGTLADEALEREGEFVSAASFMSSMGLHERISVDIPGSHHAPDLIHDLNRPLPSELRDRFNVLIDPGTMEHVFDVRSGFDNVVSALKVGGVAIHFVPIYSYNGGYFSINPNVITDFYRANGFVDIKAFILMWDRYRPFSGRSRCYPYTSVMEARHALSDHDQCRFTPHLLVFARKGHAVSELAIPIQHEDHGDGQPRLSGRILRAVLPKGAATYVSAIVRRELQLGRSRRQSFWI